MPAPPISALELVAKLDPTLVDQVRSQLVSDYESHPNIYDLTDVELVRTNQWQVQRFILEAKQDTTVASKALQHALQWRHQQGINSITCKDFPAEYYCSGYIVRYGRDVNGATVIIFRANIHRKTAEWNERVKQFFLYQIEQIDQNNDGKGVTLVIDCSGIGMSNLDLDLLKFVVTCFSQYYPKLFDAIIINELPYLLQYVFKMVQNWLPEEDRKFFHLSSKKTLTNFIRLNQLPSFLNGKNKESWNTIPEDGVVDAEQFVKLYGTKFGLKTDSDRKLAYLKPYIK